ncbi:hypothetical protein ACFVYC_18555 [Pseudarthrobacter sp. NPDC058329]|uniref:hypothetical protein n=1 Tax=Pseudarthrobacter sp. NPDC058329 TaxID=3346448 RepID=UPI0036DA8CC8
MTSLYATLLLGSCANVVLALAVAAGFIGAGLPVQGSLLTGAAVSAVGLFFMAAAALVAQIMPSARSANGTAAALVGGAYLIRGAGDALGTADASLLHVTAAWPSLSTPIGWGQRIRPFTETDTLPLLVIGAVAIVLAGVAVALRNSRDLGTSYIAADDSGAERAGAGLASMLGLAWRLQRGSLASWCFTTAALGAVAGGLGPVVRDALEGNPSVIELMSRIIPGDAGLVDLFTTAMLGIAGVLAAAAGIEAVLRLRAEEAEGRAELLLSVPASRFRWLGSTLGVAALTTTAVAVASGATAAVVLALGQAGGSSPLHRLCRRPGTHPGSTRLPCPDSTGVRSRTPLEQRRRLGRLGRRAGPWTVRRTAGPACVASKPKPIPALFGHANSSLPSGGRPADDSHRHRHGICSQPPDPETGPDSLNT